MTTRRFLLGFAVLSLSLFVSAVSTEGKTASHRVNRIDSTVRGLPTTAGKTKLSSTRLAKRRSISVRTRSCACTSVPGEWEAGGGCFTGCLRSWGVNTTTGAACAGACIAAGTGNPVAIGICAGCLGTGEWIVAGCALKCTWSGSFMPEEGPVAKGRPRTRQLRTT